MDKNVISLIKQHFKNTGMRFFFIDKIYSSPSDNFYLEINLEKFFVKIVDNLKANEILTGRKTLAQYVNLPRIVKRIDTKNKTILIQQDLEGPLFSTFFTPENLKDKNNLLYLENERNKIIKNMYSMSAEKVINENFPILKSSSILWERLFNSRFDSFYGSKSRFEYLKDKKIYINGKLKNIKISQILNDLKNFDYFKNTKTDYIKVTGHGDGHRGNIIIKNNDFFYIDTEYSQKNIPLEIELAKTYYNDFLGFLFFSHKELLLEIFESPKIYFDENSIFIDNFKIRDFNNFNFLKKTTQDRINLVKDITENYSLFDKKLFTKLLIICHILTKNPNEYTNQVFALFIGVLVYLTELDPLNIKDI